MTASCLLISTLPPGHVSAFPQDMIDLHRQRDEAKSKAQVAAKQATPVECQPSASAPLLRDEKARRDWVERELEFCCQVWALGC